MPSTHVAERIRLGDGGSQFGPKGPCRDDCLSCYGGVNNAGMSKNCSRCHHMACTARVP